MFAKRDFILNKKCIEHGNHVRLQLPGPTCGTLMEKAGIFSDKVMAYAFDINPKSLPHVPDNAIQHVCVFHKAMFYVHGSFISCMYIP